MSDFYSLTFNKIRNYKTKIKDSSIDSYLLNIKKISKELFNSTKPSIQYFRDISSVKDYVEALKSLASRKNMITSIIVMLNSYKEEFPEEIIEAYALYHKELSKKQEESYLDNVKSQREELNWITRDDIFKKMKELNDTLISWKGSKRMSLDKKQQHLVLSLYTLLPPLRNDYAIVKIVDNPEFEANEEAIDKDYNYINLSTSMLLLCKYKTDKHYGIKKIEIPVDLLNIIVDFERVKKEYFTDKLTHDFLLVNTTTGKSMKHNTLTKYINKIFYPKKVSTTLLRKVYLSERYPVTSTYRQMQEDSYVMGHNIDMAKKVYSKKL